MIITKEYLRQHPDHIFVFGDNLLKRGLGGAAALRGEPNTYGFVTKKAPDNKDSSFYRRKDYPAVFEFEMKKLIWLIKTQPQKTFLISKLGAGLANRYHIWEEVIEPRLKELEQFDNVKLIYKEE